MQPGGVSLRVAFKKGANVRRRGTPPSRVCSTCGEARRAQKPTYVEVGFCAWMAVEHENAPSVRGFRAQCVRMGAERENTSNLGGFHARMGTEHGNHPRGMCFSCLK